MKIPTKISQISVTGAVIYAVCYEGKLWKKVHLKDEYVEGKLITERYSPWVEIKNE